VAEKILILGDSHTQSLTNALKRWPLGTGFGGKKLRATFVYSGRIATNFVLRLRDGKTVLNPIMEKALFEHHLYSAHNECYFPEAADLILLFGYGNPYVFGLMRDIVGYSFDSSAPVNETSVPGTRDYFVHPEMLRELFQSGLSVYLEGVELLKNCGLNVSLLAGPPPHRDNDYIRARQSWPYVNAPFVRKSIFYAVDGIIREGAARIGVPYLDAVSPFCDEDGFLRKEYYGDGIHANLVYAREVLLGLPRPSGWGPIEVRYEPGSDIRFDAGGNSHHYTLGGWSEPEDWGMWTDGYRAELLICLERPFTGPVQLSIEARAFITPAHPMLRVCVASERVVLGECSITDLHFAPWILSIPSSVVDDKTVLNISFHVVNPVSPRELGHSEDGRLLGLGIQKIRLEVLDGTAAR
jgi:hypothetical protein